MKIVPLAQVKNQFSAYIKECQKSPVIITKNGKAVAVLAGISGGDDIDRVLLAHNPRFIQLLEEAYRNVQETGGIKNEDFWKEVKLRRARKKAA